MSGNHSRFEIESKGNRIILETKEDKVTTNEKSILIIRDKETKKTFRKATVEVLRNKHYSSQEIEAAIKGYEYTLACIRTIFYWRRWYKALRERVILLLSQILNKEEALSILDEILPKTAFVHFLQMLEIFLYLIFCSKENVSVVTLSSPKKEGDKRSEDGRNRPG